MKFIVRKCPANFLYLKSQSYNRELFEDVNSSYLSMARDYLKSLIVGNQKEYDPENEEWTTL